MLFVFVGGGAHYGALYLSWKRQREFLDKFIQKARRSAWGDNMSIQSIPGLDFAPPAPQPETDDTSAQPLNRKERRLQEKNSKKGKPAPATTQSSDAQPRQRHVERRKVVAENGKTLIVESTGDVYLVEETEDGTEELLLNVGLKSLHTMINS
jgi:hypothetical protein